MSSVISANVCAHGYVRVISVPLYLYTFSVSLVRPSLETCHSPQHNLPSLVPQLSLVNTTKSTHAGQPSAKRLAAATVHDAGTRDLCSLKAAKTQSALSRSHTNSVADKSLGNSTAGRTKNEHVPKRAIGWLCLPSTCAPTILSVTSCRTGKMPRIWTPF
jgi:hypothetical protein